jgi:glycine hydroxymethyltransferase
MTALVRQAVPSRRFRAGVLAVGLIAGVLAGATPTTTSSGAPSKAKAVLADGLAERTRAAAAELLERHPLYPGLELS